MEPPSTKRVSVINESGKRLQLAPIKRAVQLVLDAHSSVDASVCVLLTTDETVRELNLKFRGIDEATDVLTFSGAEFVGAPLGDIAIAVPYARRQADMRRVPLLVEVQYLAVHGALHLVGFDDESEHERATMFAEMARIGELVGLPPESQWVSLLHAVEAT